MKAEASRQAAISAWKEDCADMDRFSKDPRCASLVGSFLDQRGRKIVSSKFYPPSNTVLVFDNGTEFNHVALDDGN